MIPQAERQMKAVKWTEGNRIWALLDCAVTEICAH